MNNVILAIYLITMNLTYSQMSDFYIDVKEIETSQDEGILGNTSNMISGNSKLKNVIIYNFLNMDKFLKKEDIILDRNPLLKVLLVSKKKCSNKVKSEKLQYHLNTQFNLIVDSTIHQADFIVIESLGDLSKQISQSKNSSIGYKDSIIIFDNVSINEFLQYVKSNNNLKIELNSQVFEKYSKQRVSLNIHENYLESEETLSSKLKELKINFKIEQREYLQYSVTKR